ncbi:MAG: hypothetical protein KC731_43350 [Myxococcales bacterium]|nr:hypothetical protein [Myxococcales bacterium]
MTARIVGAELERMAAESSPETRSIIVELEAPAPRVELETSGGAARLKRVVARAVDERETLKQRLAEASAFLEDLVGRPPVVLEAAHAVVTRVTGAQLRVVAAQRFAREIRENKVRG